MFVYIKNEKKIPGGPNLPNYLVFAITFLYFDIFCDLFYQKIPSKFKIQNLKKWLKKVSSLKIKYFSLNYGTIQFPKVLVTK